jgi:hypothetical protein
MWDVKGDGGNYTSITHCEDEWTPFQNHYFSENLVTSGIELENSGYLARNSNHQATGGLFGLVVRVPGYRSRGPGFDSQCYQIF